MIMLSVSDVVVMDHNYDENGICTNCGAYSEQALSSVTTPSNIAGPSAQDALIIYVVIFAVVVVMVLIGMLWSKLKKRKEQSSV